MRLTLQSMAAFIRIVKTQVLANPVPQSYCGMCVIRDTNGSGSEEVWPSNRGKHSNQCLERPCDVQCMEACNY